MEKIIVGFIFICLACEPAEKRSKAQALNRETEQERYLKSTPDASLDFYCEFNARIDSKTRVEICNIVNAKSSVLSADIVIEIKDHNIDTVEVVIFSFDENGNRMIEDLYSDLNTILNSIPISNILTFKQLKDGPYITRLQMERFCNGYVTNVEIGDVTAQRLIRKDTMSSEDYGRIEVPTQGK